MTDATTLTDEDLAEIEQRLNAATPGPWQQHELYPKVIVAASAPEMSLLSVDAEGTATFWSQEDAALAAHAPTDVASLIAEVRRLQDREQAMRQLLLAVNPASDFADGYCDDVNGRNWFDARESLIGSAGN